MSKGGDFVASHIYGPHLPGGRHSHNPVAMKQARREMMYRRMLTELACNRFKWENLPEEIDPRYLELTLFRNTLCVFFHSSGLPDHALIDGAPGEPKIDPYNKYFALTGSPAGTLDMYNNARSFQVTGNSMLNAVVDINNAVPIWANYLRYPDHDIVEIFSEQLAEFDQSISIAAMNMRNTNFVVVNENQRLSAQNMVAQRDRGEPVIYMQKDKMGLSLADAFSAIDMKVHPDTLPKLMIAKSKLWNECMTLLGINNANQDKRERLVADEVAANDDQIDSVRQIALNARQQACDEINRKFGLNVSVDFHSNDVDETAMMGGEDNGDLHNDSESGDGTDR